jgi:hypothetical protein
MKRALCALNPHTSCESSYANRDVHFLNRGSNRRKIVSLCEWLLRQEQAKAIAR